jgi:hypothetical protein
LNENPQTSNSFGLQPESEHSSNHGASKDIMLCQECRRDPDVLFLSIVKQVNVVKDVPKFPPFSFLDNITFLVYDLSKAYTKGLVTNGPDGS